jgi:hypothetical protein
MVWLACTSRRGGATARCFVLLGTALSLPCRPLLAPPVFAAAANGYSEAMEHEEQADRMEQEADRMEEASDELSDRIEETRRDWEHKENDPSMPGAQPEEKDGTATGNPEAAGSDE